MNLTKSTILDTCDNSSDCPAEFYEWSFFIKETKKTEHVMNKLSVVIPTWNEEKNIQELIKQIDSSLSGCGIVYEIIFIDDHSTDKTRDAIFYHEKKYPVRMFSKKGKRGKAQSLIEGFSNAKYNLICMIDADLQYSPEYIPEMLKKINRNTDIVVAKRTEQKTSLLRQIISKAFSLFFGKILHGMPYDVQSGLKVFKREILERVNLDPSPWAFDLEFLVKAQNAGYTIKSSGIVFRPRYAGKEKINILKASFEIGLSAIKLKFCSPEIVPLHPSTVKREGPGFHYKGNKFIHHSLLDHGESAFKSLSKKQSVALGIFALITLSAIILDWHTTAIALIASLSILYFCDLLFNLFLIYKSFSKKPEINISKTEIEKVDENTWPTYTIFCPLYKEWEVLPQFVTAINRLNYPKDKLQVLLLLEENDKETVQKAELYNLPSYFQTVIVPDSLPKTKPKACNYGLQKARGKYSVVYDAEDIPEPNQLKKTVIAFNKAGCQVTCIQAKLNFYNPHQNIITRVFTAEYSLWFDLVLTGLQSINAPIPLGGTSNHFRTSDLKDVKGWDSFNVTEDCDLGVRLVKKGYRTAILNSTTYEEANSDFVNWFWQRTRWIKGYLQTYLVHMRNPGEFTKNTKKTNLIIFQLVVGGKVLSMLINPFMWIITFLYFATRSTLGTFIESFFPPPVLYVGVFSLFIGNFLYMYYYMIGCAKRKYFGLIHYVFLVPFYWLGMSLAAYTATFKLIKQPYHWSKTKHGLHLDNEDVIKHARGIIGRNLVDRELIDPVPAPVVIPGTFTLKKTNYSKRVSEIDGIS
ncbi:MAG: hypothetical protein A2857_06675 [Candidatus Levybacteria bacterium RIFCSPHIGHO2_01_FULL_36_15]|nr:MAG: hypothetical protein A2857_06675 [Candidatus Levybacteria bacterium RIFCSPHIGHO2_01_FULL_36_15]